MYIPEQVQLGLYIGSEIVSALILIILVVSLFIHDDMKQNDNRFFFCSLLSMLAIIVFDILVELGGYEIESIALYKTIVLLSYVSVNIFSVFYTFYMAAVLKKKAFINTNVGYVIIFFAGAMSIIWAVDIVYDMGWFLSVLPNCTYHTSSSYWIAYIAPLLIGVFDALLALSFRELIGFKGVLPWILLACCPISMAFLIKPLGTYAVYTAEVLSLLILYSFEHNQREKKSAIMEKELADSKMKLMLSQIQPHFMYNSLNTIYYLIEENPEEAQEAVSTFSDYLRQNVNSLKSDKPVLFSEEMNHTEAYLYLEHMRFGEKLKIEKDIQVSYFLVPPLTLQPLVENAVKHGLGPKGGEGTIKIISREEADDFVIEVLDDGVGFEAPSFDAPDNTHTHVGIINVDSRLKSVCGGHLSIKSSPAGGTEITIRLPKVQQNSLGGEKLQ